MSHYINLNSLDNNKQSTCHSHKILKLPKQPLLLAKFSIGNLRGSLKLC